MFPPDNTHTHSLTHTHTQTWIKSLSIIDTTNVPTLLVSVVAMAALIGFKVLNKWLKKENAASRDILGPTEKMESEKG